MRKLLYKIFWFVSEIKNQKMINSVIYSARVGADVCGPCYQNDVESQYWKSSLKLQEKKRQGCSSWFQNYDYLTRKWENTRHQRSWIMQVCFLLHVIFYQKTNIKYYSIHVLKTILSTKTLKKYSNVLWIKWLKPRR